MRLIGIAVLALILFAFVAIAVNRSEDLFETGGLQDIRDGREVHVLETGEAELPDKIEGKAGHVDLEVLQSDEWTALAGFSGHRRFSLPLPRDTAFSAAVLEIFAQTEMEVETAGRLKFEVNGRRRGEIVLNPGETDMRIRIPLEPFDLERPWIDVSVTVDGSNPKAECVDDWTGGVVVTIEPETHVRVALDEPITSTADALISSGFPVRIVWPSTTPEAITSADPVISWRWLPFVAKASFVDKEVAREIDVEVPIEDVVELHHWVVQQENIRRQLDGDNNLSWPLLIVGQDGASASREFRNRTSWVHRYSRTSLPDLQLPDTLDLKMQMVSTDTSASWLLIVFLNGDIVYSRTLPATQTTFEQSIALPQNVQTIDNELRVSLISDEEKTGRCVQGRPAAAKIRVGTQLDRRGADSDEIYAGVLNAMAPEITLTIEKPITAHDLNFGFLALSKIFLHNSFDYREGGLDNLDRLQPSVTIVSAENLTSAVERMKGEGGPFWVAYSVVTTAPKPEVFAFEGRDPKLMAAIGLYRPESVLIVVPATQGE
ncbi:hypothetical protein [Tropicibacter sp. Alg240-R139]|uniref:hypothetical protein n=1 Tax=Tropicibacter sp. Alg240-R139 TaxID=2305991 RepID=UPI0013E0CC3F|nr:hypothetical protein [Tropicibacter sp. Alg240-R139]